MCKKKNIFMIISLILMVIFVLNFKLIFVDGQSMAPTLKNNQIMLINKNIEKYNKNNIIVFDTKEYDVCVKRIIATGGDNVQLNNGCIYVNGIKISPYNCDETLKTNYKLEKDQYFVIGDNYNASIDSRAYGPIDESDIIGEVI